MLLAGRAVPAGSQPLVRRRRDQRQGGPPAFPPQVVGQLVGGDGKQVSLQRPPRVEVGQAGQKADERLLHDVLGRGPVAGAALDERQQPALEPPDQLLPRLRVLLADAADQRGVGVGGQGHGDWGSSIALACATAWIKQCCLVNQRQALLVPSSGTP